MTGLAKRVLACFKSDFYLKVLERFKVEFWEVLVPIKVRYSAQYIHKHNDYAILFYVKWSLQGCKLK